MNTACDRLTHAQQRLTEKGWLQGRFRRYTGTVDLRTLAYDHAGPACLVGALVADEELENDKIPFYELPGLKEALKALGFRYTYDAYRWNDALERTIEQVQDRIETAKIEACSEAAEKED